MLARADADAEHAVAFIKDELASVRRGQAADGLLGFHHFKCSGTAPEQ